MTSLQYEHRLKRIAFIGNYIPRQCGIATFTTDICEATAAAYPAINCIAVPMNDVDEAYDYPDRVRFEVSERNINSYRSAAGFLNMNEVDLVCLQFEHGIFGGRAGCHILSLLSRLKMPVVTTLHTVLETPDVHHRRVVDRVAAYSERIIVMSERGRRILQTIYGVAPDRIDVIPHGIPDVPFVDPSFHKDAFGVEGKTVLLSFGLLSSNKGIENVIAALPEIITDFPDVVFILVGATHPHVKRTEGERYRMSLRALARELDVEDRILYCNRFVSLEELVEYISAADIYITPYLNPAQIVSGTLAYTVGAGKAVVSTPYWHAEELLADGRGILVPFNDPSAIAREVKGLLENEVERHAMRKRAYLYGRNMIWTEVAVKYMASFERAQKERRSSTARNGNGRWVPPLGEDLPPINLDHLRRMTDATGMLQHAVLTIPNYHEGYCTDDNARALLVCTLLEQTGSPVAAELSARFLALVWYALNGAEGRFRNFMDYQRNWLEERGSEDCHGRTLWALGTVLGHSTNPALPNIAGRLFEQALSAILSTDGTRSWAFALLGIHEYLHRFQGDRVANQVRDELATRLFQKYLENRSDDWLWYENSLTYCNAVLPHALLISGHSMRNTDMSEAAIESLTWLAILQRSESPRNYHFVPIGCNGFYERGGARARFDQQPVEAQAMITACLEAYRLTDDREWYIEARRAFDWYLGRNDLGLPLYDHKTGGCRDGLHSDRANENQGAESTLAFLQSLLELSLLEGISNPAEATHYERATS